MNVKTILFVENDPVALQMYRNRLEREGFHLQTAQDGLEALKALAELTPDVVVLDMMLPKLTGDDVIRFVRADPRLKSLPIVVFSNAPMAELPQEISATGLTRHLIKTDSTFPMLLQTIQELIATASAGKGVEVPPPDTAATKTTTAASQSETISKASQEVTSRCAEFMKEALAEVPKIREHCLAYIKAPSSPASLQHLPILYQRVRSMSTNAANVGCARVALLTAAFDALLSEIMVKPSWVTPSILQTIAQAVDCLGLLLNSNEADLVQPMPPVKVLAVDDDIVCNHVMITTLKRAKFDAKCVEDPHTALQLLEANRYDLIFLDINMPDMTGFELCEKLRRIPHCKSTPVIFITGHNNFDNRKQSVLSGGHDFITKPVSPSELALKATLHLLKNRTQRASAPNSDTQRISAGVSKNGAAPAAETQATVQAEIPPKIPADIAASQAGSSETVNPLAGQPQPSPTTDPTAQPAAASQADPPVPSQTATVAPPETPQPAFESAVAVPPIEPPAVLDLAAPEPPPTVPVELPVELVPAQSDPPPVNQVPAPTTTAEELLVFQPTIPAPLSEPPSVLEAAAQEPPPTLAIEQPAQPDAAPIESIPAAQPTELAPAAEAQPAPGSTAMTALSEQPPVIESAAAEPPPTLPFEQPAQLVPSQTDAPPADRLLEATTAAEAQSVSESAIAPQSNEPTAPVESAAQEPPPKLPVEQPAQIVPAQTDTASVDQLFEVATVAAALPAVESAVVAPSAEPSAAAEPAAQVPPASQLMAPPTQLDAAPTEQFAPAQPADGAPAAEAQPTPESAGIVSQSKPSFVVESAALEPAQAAPVEQTPPPSEPQAAGQSLPETMPSAFSTQESAPVEPVVENDPGAVVPLAALLSGDPETNGALETVADPAASSETIQSITAEAANGPSEGPPTAEETTPAPSQSVISPKSTTPAPVSGPLDVEPPAASVPSLAEQNGQVAGESRAPIFNLAGSSTETGTTNVVEANPAAANLAFDPGTALKPAVNIGSSSNVIANNRSRDQFDKIAVVVGKIMFGDDDLTERNLRLVRIALQHHNLDEILNAPTASPHEEAEDALP